MKSALVFACGVAVFLTSTCVVADPPTIAAVVSQSGDTVIITGQVDDEYIPGVELRIEAFIPLGGAIPLDEDGNFRISLDPDIGKKLILIATDLEGFETKKALHVE